MKLSLLEQFKIALATLTESWEHRNATHWALQDMKRELAAAEMFKKLISPGDGPEDRKAAYLLVREKYPKANFDDLIERFGLDEFVKKGTRR